MTGEGGESWVGKAEKERGVHTWGRLGDRVALGPIMRIPPLLPPSIAAPQVLGTFATGRLEAFLPQKCLEPEQLKDPQISAAIARAMARFHAVPGPVRSC